MSDTGDNELTEAEAQALLDRLEQAIDDTDAVPPWLRRFANESHRLVSFEGELAEILADSLDTAPVAMRSSGAVRRIEFVSGDVTIRLEIDGMTTDGSIEPTHATLSLISQGGEQHIAVNRRGFFTVDTPVGPFRLFLVTEERQVKTEWISQR